MNTGARIRTIIAWLAAVVGAYLLATTFATLSVVRSLRSLDVPVSFTDIVGMVVHDWGGMTGLFLPIIAIGFAIALPLAAALVRRWPWRRAAWFAVAGAAALLVAHLALKAAFDITPVAVARTVPGLLTQALAGALGGGLFAVLAARTRTA